MIKSTGIQKLTFIVLFTGMIISIFFPFYASTSEGLFFNRYTVMGEYIKNEDYFSIYNGFNSIFALFNITCTFIIILLFFLANLKLRSLAIILTSIFICSLIMVGIGQIASGFVLSPPDNLLSGFYILLICETLILICIFKLSCNQNMKEFNQNLLDNL